MNYLNARLPGIVSVETPFSSHSSNSISNKRNLNNVSRENPRTRVYAMLLRFVRMGHRYLIEFATKYTFNPYAEVSRDFAGFRLQFWRCLPVIQKLFKFADSLQKFIENTSNFVLRRETVSYIEKFCIR